MWFHPLQLRDKFDYDGDGTITLDEVNNFLNVELAFCFTLYGFETPHYTIRV